MKRLVAVLIALFTSARAVADDEHLGKRGSLVITNGTEIVANRVEGRVSIGFSGDTFVAERLSVGVELAGILAMTSTIVAGARAGYTVPLKGPLSLWPRGELRTLFSHFGPGPGHGGRSAFGVSAVLSLPLMLTLAPHFFIGAGPVLELRPLAVNVGGFAGASGTTYGVDTMIGGWF